MHWRDPRTARRSLGLLLAALALMLAGTGTPGPLAARATAQGQAPTARYALKVITFTPPLALVVAQERGFFAAEGLEVENVITQSSAQLMRGVIDGTYDIGCTNPDNWITYVVRDGADVFMFMGVDTGGERTVVVRPEIQTAEDLRGRAIAVDAVDSGLVMILWKVLADHGVDFRTGDPQLVPVGTTSLRLDSMERGETFAAITSGPDTERALALGFRVLGRSSDHLPDYPGPQCGTTRRWAAAHPDALVHFVRAMVAAIDWARQNRDVAIALYRDTRGVSQQAAEETYQALQPDGTVNVAGIQTILDLRVALGFLQPPAPPAERFYDTRYWEQATGRQHP